jgi:hypothetical protein
LKQGQNFPQLNIADVTQVVFTLVQHTLEAQVSCLHVGLDFAVSKELFNETQSHIILHLFYSQHCVGKLQGGGVAASWLIEPFVIDLAPTSCTSYNMASLAI